MATHSSILAWWIPGTEEPGGLPSMGLHRVRHDWSDLAAAAAVLNSTWSQRVGHGWATELNWTGDIYDPIVLIVQSQNPVWLLATPWTAAQWASLSSTISQSILKFMSIQWCYLNISSSAFPFVFCLQPFPALGSFPMSCLFIARVVFSYPKLSLQSWSFSTSPSNEYSGLISFRINWFDILAVQGILKGLLQHHSLKAPILWCSASLMIQLSVSYMTTGRTIALTTWTLSTVSAF